MQQSAGLFSIPGEHQPIPGCTVSHQLFQEDGRALYFFSLAAHTGISAESYGYHKVLTIYEGSMEVYTTSGDCWTVNPGESIITPLDVPVGMRCTEPCIYTELGLRKGITMNEMLKAGQVFKMAELLPYQENKIINMDLVNEPNMKFVLMSFGAGTGLSEHAAPGEALVFALDGEAVIGYEGKDYVIHAGETFKFDKMGKHAVSATTNFKMALMLLLKDTPHK